MVMILLKQTVGRLPQVFWLTLAIQSAWGQSASDERLRFRSPGGERFFVGQRIAIEVELPDSARDSVLHLPALGDEGIIELEPAPASGPDAGEKPEIRRGFILAKESGMLQLPALTAEKKGRLWRSNPLKFEIRPVPFAGRTSAFHGGVGPIELQASWNLESLALGERRTLEIRKLGEGVLGELGTPLVPRPRSKGSVRVELDGVETSNSPPMRTERYSVRALATGTLEFEPLVSETFDPVTGRFLRQSVKIPALEVTEGPVLEHDDDFAASKQNQYFWPSLLAMLGLIGAFLVALLMRWKPKFRLSPGQRVMRGVRQVERLPAEQPPREFARQILELLATSVRESESTAIGVLTPPLAHTLWNVGPNGDRLASRAADLVRRCESAVYQREEIQARDVRAWNEATRKEAMSLLLALQAWSQGK